MLTGPNLAREIAAEEPTATVIACSDHDRAVALQHACGTGYFRAYTETDVIGCEVGGANKNVIALACGMAAGMGFGDNTRASLITRGLAETARLGVALGADPMTFAGLAGLGDLVATCSSPLSRNRTLRRAAGPRGDAGAGRGGQPRPGGRGRQVVLVDLRAGRAARGGAADRGRGAPGLPRGAVGGRDGQGADQPGAAGRTLVTAARATGPGACTAAARPVPLGDPLHPGPVLSSTFHLGLPGEPTPPDSYGRAGNPTWRALEAAIGELDGGECVRLRLRDGRDPGGVRAGRGGRRAGAAVRRLLPGPVAGPRGVRAARGEGARGADRGGVAAGVLDGAALVLLETPSNPGLEVADIAAAAAAAHAAGALLAVDNTTATPLGQRPLELGADLVVASDTKALAGHGDVVLGHVSTRDSGAGRAAARGPHPGWRGARPDGGLAGPPRPGHPGPAAGPAGGERGRAGRGAARASRGVGRALAGPTGRPGARDRGPADAALERGAAVHPALGGGGRASSWPRPGWSARRPASAGCAAPRTAGSAGATPVPPGLIRFSAGCEDPDDLVHDVRHRAGRGDVSAPIRRFGVAQGRSHVRNPAAAMV